MLSAPTTAAQTPFAHGKTKQNFFFNIHKEMGFCINEQHNNCTGYFSFLALRKVQLPSLWRTAAYLLYFPPRCDLTCAATQLGVGCHLGSFCFHRAVLSTNNVQLDSWDLAIQCGHHMSGFGKGWLPSSLSGCQDGFAWAMLSQEACCVGFENSRSPAAVWSPFECSWGGNSIWVMLNCEKVASCYYIICHFAHRECAIKTGKTFHFN